MPLKLSRGVARFNRRYNNPLQLRYAWLLPPWAVICHRGRRSGRLYRTPVNAWRRGSRLAVVVLYGEESDWVRNVLAAGGQVVRGGRTYELLGARIVDPDRSGGELPPVARRYGRVTGKVLLGTLGARIGGFGPGPRS